MTSLEGVESVHNITPEYKGNTSHTTPMEVTKYVCCDSLCLSKKNLKYVPNDIFEMYNIKTLYLEGNKILSLPDNLFTGLSNLVWLDLRNNELTQLPNSIGQHRFLKTLLLGGNPIQHLPLELGNLVTLKALNLRDCPIEFPPQEIVQQGLQCILQFLRSQMVNQPVCAVSEMPCVERLKLTESSLDCSEDAPYGADLQRFQELKNRMMQMEKEHDYGEKELSEGCMPPRLLSHKMQYWKMPEERKLAAMKKLKERQATQEQQRKDQDLLQKWRAQAKVLQERRALAYREEQGERARSEEAQRNSCAPYATDPLYKKDSVEMLPRDEQGHRLKTPASKKLLEELRSTRDMELELKIRAHVQKLQQRRRKLSGPAQWTEEREAARQDMEEVKKLQSELAERRQERDLDYRFTAFTGESVPNFDNS